MENKIKQTYNELSKIAKENGFYLAPEKVWNEVCNTLQYLRSENQRLMKRNEELRINLRELNNEK